MAFRYRLYLESGDDVGTFTTAVPDWRVGDELLTGDRNRFRILNIVTDENVPGDDFHGLFVVTPLKPAEP
jgi:hypothetical protein